VPSDSLVAAPLRRDQGIIVACVVVITALAWAYLFLLDHRMAAHSGMSMMGMPMPVRWTAADGFFAFLMWAVMMIGMMSASAMPVLLLFASMQRSREQQGVALSVPLFGLGYAAVWIGFSAAAALAQWMLLDATLLSPTLATSSRALWSAILIAAGVYQLSPAKSSCLRRCQSPLGFLMSNWRDGARGALQMGLRHGSYCLGCCWALMLVLFVVGVMDLRWVAALTVFILLEKTGRGGLYVARAGGVLMIMAGVWRAMT
jgi:predicted metal-binding membrane protein